MAHIETNVVELTHLQELRSPVAQTNASMCLLNGNNNVGRKRSEEVRAFSSRFDRRLHRLQAQHSQHVSEQRLVAAKPADPEQLKKLNTVITSLHSASKLSQTQVALQAHLRDALTATMQKRWPGCELALFGSAGSGFGTKGSDIDLCLCLQDMHDEREACCATMTRALVQSRTQFLGQAAVKAFGDQLLEKQEGEANEMAEMVIRYCTGTYVHRLLSFA
jgi:DNA polymerase sigma